MKILKTTRRYATLIYACALFHVTALVTAIAIIQYLLNHAPQLNVP